MTIPILTVGAMFFICSYIFTTDFKAEQQRHTRVKEAYAEKEELVHKNLKEHAIITDQLEVLLQAFKKEKRLELWAKNKQDKQFRLIQTYRFCTTSGTLGPKNKEGDKQIPEGYYYIDRFNPQSTYHLSLGLDYPNVADKKRSTSKKLGGDIFIHGKCVTEGCIPLTDEKIKELYLYVVEARNNGQQKIMVAIYPGRMDAVNYNLLQHAYHQQPHLLRFWADLKTGYDTFERTREQPQVRVQQGGRYIIR